MIVFEETCALEQRAQALGAPVRVGGKLGPDDVIVHAFREAREHVFGLGYLEERLGIPLADLNEDDGFRLSAVTWVRNGQPVLPQLVGQVIGRNPSDGIPLGAWVAPVGHLPQLHDATHARILPALREVSGPLEVELLIRRRPHDPGWVQSGLAFDGPLAYAVAGLLDDVEGSLLHVYDGRARYGSLSIRHGACAVLRLYPDEPDDFVGHENVLLTGKPGSEVYVIGRGSDPATAFGHAADLAQKYGWPCDVTETALECRRDLDRAVRRFGGRARDAWRVRRASP